MLVVRRFAIWAWAQNLLKVFGKQHFALKQQVGQLVVLIFVFGQHFLRLGVCFVDDALCLFVDGAGRLFAVWFGE